MESDAILETAGVKVDWRSLGLLLILAAGLRLYFSVGIGIADDLAFVAHALEITREKGLNLGTDQTARIMTYLPISLAYLVGGGFGPITTHVYHFICSLLTIVTSFFLGRLLFGMKAGIFSAIFLSFVPLHILFSSSIIPSIPETMWAGLAVWLFCAVEQRWKKNGSRCQYIKLFAVGSLTGISYLCRETGVVLLVVFFTYFGTEMLGRRKEFATCLKHAACVFFGFFFIFAVESVAYFILTKNWLYRWSVVSAAQSVPIEPWSSWDSHLMSLLNITDLGSVTSLGLFENLRDRAWSSLGFMGILILVSLLWFFVRHFKGTKKVVVLWFLVYFLFLSFGSGSLSSYVPIRKFPRYQILFLTSSSVMVGALMAALFRGMVLRGIVFVVGAFLVISSVYYTYFGQLRDKARYQGVKVVQQLIRQHTDPKLPIFMDTESAFLEHLDDHKPRYTYSDIAEFDGKSRGGAYVVTNRRNSDRRFIHTYPELDKPFLHHIPESWVKVAETEIGEWGYIPPGTSPVLFYVPPDQIGF